MVEPEAIQTVVKEAAIKTAKAAVMMIAEADAGPASGINMVSWGEAYRRRHDIPA